MPKMKKVTVIKTFTSEVEIEIPVDATKEEVSNLVLPVGNDAKQWESTLISDVDNDDETLFEFW